MKYTKLGASELTVSRACMGCMGFGDSQAGQHHWTLGEEDSRAIIKQGLEAGINFFDTAIAYQGGSSERYLGRALKDFARREDVVVATKFLPRTDEDIAAGVSGSEHIRRSLDLSLSNLGMDYVDLYIYHMWDYRTPMEEILAGLDSVVRAGKARYIGISNCYAWQLAKMNALAGAEGFPRFVSIQGHYNLIFREEEREMVPLCKQDNIALTPYSALAAGRLSRKSGESSKRLQEDAYARSKYDRTQDQDRVIIERVEQLAQRLGVSMTQVSLAWLMSKVSSPVVGMTKPTHVQGAVDATELVLSPEDCAWLEEPYLPHALVGVMAENHA
ncbi:aryl-alcohol dehydrogenase [Bombiscardovia apis]|uniref:Aryl-alcohol dehydrogenase n=1 Tax=Bombiscardovia apis TaxID=2932182 RepID=A0ABM8BEF4_9BIFI|nr:aldo/keto reductase [Bombiscardovia apis]BDR55312.1 aryl-alcohol dehydrogenase [Bombiscardovia apis]